MEKLKEGKTMRVRISKKKYEKINEYAIEKGLKSGAHILDELMCEYIDKHDL